MFSHLYGIQNLLKSGGQYLYDDEAITSNISKCKELAGVLETSLGPNGMKKLVINHIDKLFVTSDNATLLNQLEVQHPAAKIIMSAAQMQVQEYGDGSNYVIVLAGELLHSARLLMQEGYHMSDVIKGYNAALEKILSTLEETICYKVNNIRSHDEIQQIITCVLKPKVISCQSYIGSLVAKAVLQILPPNPVHLNLDNFRVAKVLANDLQSSFVIQGMVVTRDVSSTCNKKENCKVIVLGCGLELSTTEAKGTVLIHSADQLLSFSKGEEDEIERIVKSIANMGVEAIIVGGNISDLGQHYCNKYNLLTLKCQSKFDLRRLCRTLKAPSMVRLGCPTPEEIGFAQSITVQTISSSRITVIQTPDSEVSTIVLRGATSQLLDEVERGIYNAVRTIKNITKDNQFLPGAGATEIEIALQLYNYATNFEGQEQYAIKKFGEAFEKIPRIIADNCGLNGTDVMTHLYAMHKQGKKTFGVDIKRVTKNGVANVLKHSVTSDVLDHFKMRQNSIKLALDAVTTVLQVNKICTARPAGGPKPPQQSGNWDED